MLLPPLPPLPFGYVFVVTSDGEYVRDSAGGFVITPGTSPSFPETGGRVLFADTEPPPINATHILLNQSAALFLPVPYDLSSRFVEIQPAFQTITLVFTKPNGSTFIVEVVPPQLLLYLAIVQSQDYFVYTFDDNELDQTGRWQVYYSIGFDYVSASYMFFIYPP